MNYYTRHIGDYLKDTAHLSLLEHGVYSRLLDVYYTREKPFAPGEAHRLVGARTDEERAAVDSVLAEFFQDGRQGRCDREIERYQVKAEHNREVGKRGGRPKLETQTEPRNNPVGFCKEPKPNPPNSQQPIANRREEEKISNPTGSPSSATPPRTVSRFPPGFEAFWEAYPKKVGKDAALKAYAKRRFTPPQQREVLEAVGRQKAWDGWRRDGGQFIPNPSTWLNEGRWQDEPPQTSDRGDPFSGAM